MDYDEIDELRRIDPAWRLLRAEHAPLLVSFLGRVFVDENVRGIAASELVDRLDDELYALNERLGEGTFPRRAKDYLDDWANIESGWLRKYYADRDEAQFDALPAVERAVTFVRSLERREFIGTESRLNTAFELLRQIVPTAANASTTPVAAANPAGRRRSSPTPCWPRRSHINSSSRRTPRERSGSSSSTRRSAAARTSPPSSGCACSAGSGCSC